jgi:hypothetical protein
MRPPFQKLNRTETIVAIFGYFIATLFFLQTILFVSLPPFDDLYSSGSTDVGKLKLIYGVAESNLLSLKYSLSSFIIFLGTHAWVIWLESQRTAQANSENQREIISRIDSSFTVRRVGISSSANATIRESLSKATYVRNTFLNMGGFSRYSGSNENDIISIYEEFLQNAQDKVWTDIVSVNEIYEFRHNKIFKNCTSDFGKHEIKVLRTNMPIVNFVIFENPATGYREVYFGWVHDKSNLPSQIFRSSDSGIYSIFDRIFKAMTDNKKYIEFEVDYSKPPGERTVDDNILIDKQGIWITTLFDLNGNPVNYGFVTVNFSSGKAIIGGRLLRSNQKLYQINHVNTTRSGNQLFFGYSENFEDGQQFGLCVYNFKKRKDKSEYIDGFLHANAASESGRIIGVRADGLSLSDELSDQKIIRLINSHKQKILAVRRSE